MEDYRYFTDHYVKTHMRLPAYFVGLIMGAVIYDYKFATWRLSKVKFNEKYQKKNFLNAYIFK